MQLDKKKKQSASRLKEVKLSLFADSMILQVGSNDLHKDC
jgi:lysophospholipase L1-like esterase